MKHSLPGRRPGFLILLLLLAWPQAVPAEVGSTPRPLNKTCAALCKALPELTLLECLASGLAPSGGFSGHGFPLLVKEYAPKPGRVPRARILMLGGTHGDEPAGVTTVFKWMQTLDKYHSGLFHWMVAPILNPDGLLKKPATRANGHGVDINRNMPSPLWRQIGYQYWVTRTGHDPRQFPGPEAGSEPETRWLLKVIQDFQPQAIITVHAPRGVVDYDGPGAAPKQLGHLRLARIGNFPGTLGNYAGEILGLPVVTIELPSDTKTPSAVELSAMWNDLIHWAMTTLPVSGRTKSVEAPPPPAHGAQRPAE